MATHTIFNEVNDIDFDLKKIKLQILVTENLQVKINKRIGEIAMKSGERVKPISTYVRDLIVSDTKNIK